MKIVRIAAFCPPINGRRTPESGKGIGVSPNPTKSYQQFCGLAIALDRIGDRRTLLIVRELLTGPKRFVDRLAGTPRVPTNLLAERLRRIDADLLVRREAVPPPNPAELHVLTELGSGLQESVLALVR